MNRYLYIYIAIICVIMSVWQYAFDSQLHLVVCDVGQGDAILLISGSNQLLVDAGPDEKVLECLDRNLPWWDNQLEIVVATHPDADHVGGLAAVFYHYRVGKFLSNGDSKQTAVFYKFQQLVQSNEWGPNQHFLAQTGQRFRLDSRVTIDVLSPLVETATQVDLNSGFSETILSDNLRQNLQLHTSTNDRSIALFVTMDRVRVLLMADVEEQGEIALVERGLILDSDILKVAHHGSKSSTSPLFLSRARPEISLLSLEENNQFGHPSPQVIANLAQIGAKTYQTAQLGDLHISVSGPYYELSTNWWSQNL